jgi:hypothetical protein
VQLTKIYVSLLGEASHPIKVVERVLAMESMHPSAKGDLYLALAKHADKFQPNLVTHYLDQADLYYSACNNSLGDLLTNLLRHSQPLVNLHLRVSKLNSIIDELIELGYPAFLWGASIKLSEAVLGEQGGALCSDEHRTIEFAYRCKVLQTAEKVGSRLMWCYIHLRGFMTEFQYGQFGKVIECQSILTSPMMVNLPFIKAHYCAIFAGAYAQCGNISQVEKWVSEALNWAKDGGSRNLISRIAGITSQASMMVSLFEKAADLSDISTPEQLAEHTNTYKTRYDTFEPNALQQIELDVQLGRNEDALDKLISLISYLSAQRGSVGFQEQKLVDYLAAADMLAAGVPQKELALADVTDQRVSLMLPIIT